MLREQLPVFKEKPRSYPGPAQSISDIHDLLLSPTSTN